MVCKLLQKYAWLPIFMDEINTPLLGRSLCQLKIEIFYNRQPLFKIIDPRVMNAIHQPSANTPQS